MTGMFISGKMSVGVRRTTTGVKIKISKAITMKVYGLRSAKATIHIYDSLNFLWETRLKTRSH
jgi:hypothetical protein